MDAEQIRKLKPELIKYVNGFVDCFFRRDTREHFSTYIEGQLSDLAQKSCEPIALAAGVPARNLQEFLGAYKWNEDLRGTASSRAWSVRTRAPTRSASSTRPAM